MGVAFTPAPWERTSNSENNNTSFGVLHTHGARDPTKSSQQAHGAEVSSLHKRKQLMEQEQ